MLFGNGLTRTVVDIADGLTWFTDDPTGEVIEVNPATGRPETRLDVGAPGDALDLAQYDGRLIVTNRTTGELVSFDLTSILTSGQRRITPGAATDVLHHGDDVFLVDRERGTIAAIDPVTTDTIGEMWASPEGIADAAIDGTGQVWSIDPKGLLTELRWSASSRSFVIEEDRQIDHSGARSVLVGHDQGVTVFGPDEGIVVQVGTGEPTRSSPTRRGWPATSPYPTSHRRRWCPSPHPRPARSRSSRRLRARGRRERDRLRGARTSGGLRGHGLRAVHRRRRVVRLTADGQRAGADIEVPDEGDPSLVLDDGNLLINVPGATHGVAVGPGRLGLDDRPARRRPAGGPGDPAAAPIVAGTVDDVANADAAPEPAAPARCGAITRRPPRGRRRRRSPTPPTTRPRAGGPRLVQHARPGPDQSPATARPTAPATDR